MIASKMNSCYMLPVMFFILSFNCIVANGSESESIIVDPSPFGLFTVECNLCPSNNKKLDGSCFIEELEEQIIEEQLKVETSQINDYLAFKKKY